MLIYHPLDAECIAALEVYKTLINPGENSFISMPLDQLVELWMGAVNSPIHIRWITEFKLRYLGLDSSEAEFMTHKVR